MCWLDSKKFPNLKRRRGKKKQERAHQRERKGKEGKKYIVFATLYLGGRGSLSFVSAKDDAWEGRRVSSMTEREVYGRPFVSANRRKPNEPKEFLEESFSLVFRQKNVHCPLASCKWQSKRDFLQLCHGRWIRACDGTNERARLKIRTPTPKWSAAFQVFWGSFHGCIQSIGVCIVSERLESEIENFSSVLEDGETTHVPVWYLTSCVLYRREVDWNWWALWLDKSWLKGNPFATKKGFEKLYLNLWAVDGFIFW